METTIEGVMSMLSKANQQGLVRSYRFLTGEDAEGELEAEDFRELLEGVDDLEEAAMELYKFTAFRRNPLIVDMGGGEPLATLDARELVATISAEAVFVKEAKEYAKTKEPPRQHIPRGLGRPRNPDS